MLVTEIAADALFDGSAWLMAVTATGFGAGAVAGARYSMLAELGAAGGWQGLDACWQIWPTVEFPLEMLFTVHVTVVSEVFATLGVRVTR